MKFANGVTTRFIEWSRILLLKDEKTHVLSSLQRAINELQPRTEVQEFGKQITQQTLFKKYVGNRKPEARARAIAKFREADLICRETNYRLVRGLGFDNFSDAVILTATRKITSILGPFSWAKILDHAKHGPGSTYTVKGFDVGTPRKFEATDVTRDFQTQASNLLAYFYPWANYLAGANDSIVCPLLDPVPGGRLMTVPKTDEIDRTILVEPTLNAFFQQGVGRYIRRRLWQKAAVDLNDQTTNQRLAWYGSRHGDIATIDLSMASDLISTELVRTLVGEEWFAALDMMRSKFALIDGKWEKLSMFSSMGNGFTFDLESLIFYGLVWAIASLRDFNPFWVNVFGDDIVCPSGIYDDVVDVFNRVGFKVNTEKSYSTGDFRESCGHDYKNGVNVRGLYVRQLDNMMDVIKLHNRLREWEQRLGFDLTQMRTELYLLLPYYLRLRVPPSAGDTGLHSSFDESCPTRVGAGRTGLPYSTSGWEGYAYKSIQPVLAKKETFSPGKLISALSGSSPSGNAYTVRKDPIGVTIRWTHTHSWE